MKQESCLWKCKYNDDGLCTLYHQRLKVMTTPDPYDDGLVLSYSKCTDCMEKEISCAIDDKVRDIYSFYHSFREEMDILFGDLDTLIDKRKNIYK